MFMRLSVKGADETFTDTRGETAGHIDPSPATTAGVGFPTPKSQRRMVAEAAATTRVELSRSPRMFNSGGSRSDDSVLTAAGEKAWRTPSASLEKDTCNDANPGSENELLEKPERRVLCE
ncbi:hypothetical protein EYF80_026715 [Liparis tanakae]|uniref:Uncharacterized protein n=1 Tax=Liparis tanakae TaxID=230148 RepID=A0A4Z2HBA1_9TELE|nr:hypothetical protein EYF80_026715 [Liparis tanakae]